MAVNENPQQGELPRFLLEKIQTHRPDASLTMLDDQPVILLDTWIDLNLRHFQEELFPDSGQPPSEEHPYADAVWKDFDAPEGVLPIRECAEITTNEGERIYVMTRSAFHIVEKTGLAKTTQRMESKIDEWLSAHRNADDFDLQRMAGRALIGDYSFIVPMLAGLKPAGDVEITNWRNKKTQTARERLHCFDLFCESGVLGKIEVNDDHSIYFNPESVKRILKDNSKLCTEIGLNESTPPEDAVKRILFARSRDERLVGIIYGFDEYSVMHFGQPGHTLSAAKFPMNVWDLQYQVAEEEENDDYKRLRAQYGDVFKNIEENLSRGMSPLDTLKSVANLEAQSEMRERVRRSVSRI